MSLIDDHLDDYEVAQHLYESKTWDSSDGDGGPLSSIFDSGFNGARSEMYRALIAPELFPHEKPMLIENWPAQDREEYCGGEYTVGYRQKVAA